MRTAYEARFADRVRTYATFLSASERHVAAGYVLRWPIAKERDGQTVPITAKFLG